MAHSQHPNRRSFIRLGAGVGLAGLGALALGCSTSNGGGSGSSSSAAAGNTAAGTKALGNGDRLFDVVTRYAKPAHHRTSTPEAAATLDLVEAELKSRGARTARWQYSVPKFEWEAKVEVDGREIPTIPLYFEAAGEASSDRPFVRSATLPNANGHAAVEKVIEAAKAERAQIAVVPTFGMFPPFAGVNSPLLPFGPYPALIATNTEAKLEPVSGVHTLLVSGEHEEALKTGRVTARSRSSISNGTSENITAWFGPESDRPYIVSTPLTGWYHCAGERGTGIAIALDLAADLAAAGHSVFVLATTGHEFEDYGVVRYLEQHKLNPKAVFHIGASVAAAFKDPKTGALTLGPRTWKSSINKPEIGTALATANFAPFPTWNGEGRKWSAALAPEIPLLSLAGSTPLFHTVGDVPEAATTPQLLATTYQAMRTAALALV